MLPALNELGKYRQLDSFDLTPQRRQRSSSSNFSDAPRAPLRLCYLRPEFSPDELSRSLPFSEPRFDPSFVPAVALMNLCHRHRSRECDEARENFSTCGTLSHYRESQNFGNRFARVQFDLIVREPGSTSACRRHADRAHRLSAECSNVSRIRFRQNESPVAFWAELHHDRTPARNDFVERIASQTFIGRRDTRAQLVFGQVAGTVE